MSDLCRETDEAPVREEQPLPPVDKEKEDHFKRFFHSVSGEVTYLYKVFPQW